MLKKKIKKLAIIFDFDGVIINSHKVKTQAFYDVFDKLSQEYFGFGELLTHKDVHNLDFKKKEEIMGLLQEEYELKSSIDPGIC